MANLTYPRAKVLKGTTGAGWPTATIKLAALGSGYTFDPAHEFFDDLSDVIDTVATTGRSVNAVGEWLVGDVTPGPFVDVGETLTRLVFYTDTGTPATSSLLLYMDTNADLTPISYPGVGATVAIPFPAPAYRET